MVASRAVDTSRQSASTQSYILSPLPPTIASVRWSRNTCLMTHITAVLTGGLAPKFGAPQFAVCSSMVSICVQTT
jgi:hypothetical protein